MFIGNWLERRDKLSPHKVALIDTIGQRKVTYRALFRQINRTAHFLAEDLGVVKGDRVAVLASNSVEYLDIWFALGALGGIMQNLNWRLAVPEIERVLLDAEPVALVYSGEFGQQVNALRGRLPSVKRFVALDMPAGADDLAFSRREAHPDTPTPSVELASGRSLGALLHRRDHRPPQGRSVDARQHDGQLRQYRDELGRHAG